MSFLLLLTVCFKTVESRGHLREWRYCPPIKTSFMVRYESQWFKTHRLVNIQTKLQGEEWKRKTRLNPKHIQRRFDRRSRWLPHTCILEMRSAQMKAHGQRLAGWTPGATWVPHVSPCLTYSTRRLSCFFHRLSASWRERRNIFIIIGLAVQCC